MRLRARQAGREARPAARPDGQPARFVVLGMGKLGGVELNYSSDIDLIFLYDADGKTDGPRRIEQRRVLRPPGARGRAAADRNDRAGRAPTASICGCGPRASGPMVISFEQRMRYYDVLGRTWERQAYVKARPVAGDLDLGGEFLAQLEPWIYRRYLSLADITRHQGPQAADRAAHASRGRRDAAT